MLYDRTCDNESRGQRSRITVSCSISATCRLNQAISTSCIPSRLHLCALLVLTADKEHGEVMPRSRDYGFTFPSTVHHLLL